MTTKSDEVYKAAGGPKREDLKRGDCNRREHGRRYHGYRRRPHPVKDKAGGEIAQSAADAGGIICLTGVGAGGAAGKIVADRAAAAVLKNNVIFGSVNANKRHWYRAGQNLKAADPKWLRRLITRCEKPEDFQQALTRQPDDIKVVIQFSQI